MNLFDHAFVILIVAIYPVVSYISFRRLLRRVAAGEKISRSEMYRNTFISHWAIFFIFIALWAYGGQPWAAIGINFEFGLWFGIGGKHGDSR